MVVKLIVLVFCQVLFFNMINGTFDIISRDQWNARDAKQEAEPLTLKPAPYVVIHHSETPGCSDQRACSKKVQSIQNFHMDVRGWDDIGYNFLVGEDGMVYEGRGWDARGAHSKEYNSKSIGICIIGNFTSQLPSDVAINSTKMLIKEGINNSSNGTNNIATNYTLLGHRQTANTNCPGNSLYNLIKTWDHWKANP